MQQFQQVLKRLLDNLGFLNQDEQLSLTNLAVMIFVGITAFRGLFGNAVFHYNDFVWTVQPIDFAATLPLLFSLANYSHKRMISGKGDSNSPK
jgi:hypothetical protein